MHKNESFFQAITIKKQSIKNGGIEKLQGFVRCGNIHNDQLFICVIVRSRQSYNKLKTPRRGDPPVPPGDWGYGQILTTTPLCLHFNIHCFRNNSSKKCAREMNICQKKYYCLDFYKKYGLLQFDFCSSPV